MATLITGSDLVNWLRSKEFVRYVWGGANPITGWDCSGCMNWVIGAQFHLAIPGYAPYGFNDMSGHGPVVQDWIDWIGVTRGVFPNVSPLPGDLIAWQPNVHIGMAFSPTQFVSAANPNQGTIEADIGSFFPWAPFVLRLVQIRAGATLPSIPAPPGPGNDDYSPRISRTAEQLAEAGRNAYRQAAAIRSLRL